MARKYKVKGYSALPEWHEQVARSATALGISASDYLRRAVEFYEGAGSAPAEQGKMPMLVKMPRVCQGRESNPEWECTDTAHELGNQCTPCYLADKDIRAEADAERERKRGGVASNSRY